MVISGLGVVWTSNSDRMISSSEERESSNLSSRVNLLAPHVPRWPSDKPIIELCGVSKIFGQQEVIRDLDLKIMPGITTVIAGESGSGKSVLLKMMNGLILPDQGEVYLFM